VPFASVVQCSFGGRELFPERILRVVGLGQPSDELRLLPGKVGRRPTHLRGVPFASVVQCSFGGRELFPERILRIVGLGQPTDELRLLLGKSRRGESLIRDPTSLCMLEREPRFDELLTQRIANPRLARELGLEFGVLFGSSLLAVVLLGRDPVLGTPQRGVEIGQPLFKSLTRNDGFTKFREQRRFAPRQAFCGCSGIRVAILARLPGGRKRRRRASVGRIALPYDLCSFRREVRVMLRESVSQRGRVGEPPLILGSKRFVCVRELGFKRPTPLGFLGERGLQLALSAGTALRRRLLRGSACVGVPERGVAIGELLLEASGRRGG
jgi:hypothetical protein